MMSESPRPWPENAMPTPEQWADWYPTAPREERVRIAAIMLEDAERAQRCILQSHDARLEEMSGLARYDGLCSGCRLGNHSSHTLNLGGICVGCSCQARPRAEAGA